MESSASIEEASRSLDLTTDLTFSCLFYNFILKLVSKTTSWHAFVNRLSKKEKKVKHISPSEGVDIDL